jgi:bifunctional enzyme CysN/CysC
MAHQSELIAKDIGAYLHSHEHKSLLRFITCGSVDDGKSTHRAAVVRIKMIFDDQLSALERDSKRIGTRGGELDFALLVDGRPPRASRASPSMAYRFFPPRRKFIVADTPVTSSTRATW